MSEPFEYLAFAHELADAAGVVLRRHYRARVEVDYKDDASPVTIADREAERCMRELIGTRYPDHGIGGEEFANERGDAEWTWSLDPIDGTKSFVIGRPSFGTLIGLLHNGRPVLGIIDQPILHERWAGALGTPSKLNGDPIEVRSCPELAKAVLCTTSPQVFATPQEQAAFGGLERTVRFPVYGGDCYSYGLLAMGFADLVVEADLQLYDFAALVPVIEGAGGIITDWSGEPLRSGSDGRVIAAGDPRVHAHALELITRAL